MANFELTIMVPVRVRVDNMKTVKQAFMNVAPGLVGWSKERCSEEPKGYAVVLVESEEVKS